MKQLKDTLYGGLFALIFSLSVMLTILMINEITPISAIQVVRADMIVQPEITGTESDENNDITVLSIQRDITAQRFAPLDTTE